MQPVWLLLLQKADVFVVDVFVLFAVVSFVVVPLVAVTNISPQ